MTITALTLTNPGAETGTTTGWTTRSGLTLRVTSGGHSGSYQFQGGYGNSDRHTKFDQQVAVPGALEGDIDAGDVAIKMSCWHKGAAGDTAYPYVEAYASDGTTLLGGIDGPTTLPASYTEEIIYYNLPADTRYVRVGAYCNRISVSGESGSSAVNIQAYFDDFALTISDDINVDYPDANFGARLSQAPLYAWGTYPAQEVRVSQANVLAYGAAQTSDNTLEVNVHQAALYAWARPNADRKDLRVWHFIQDDHSFHGVNLGVTGSVVWDKLTDQWAKWRSPDSPIMRIEDCVAWESLNVAADTQSGKLWKIDPTGRLDYGTTPIEGTITGKLPERLRGRRDCFMAELTFSDGDPAMADSSLGFTLATSDDQGRTFLSHGLIEGANLGGSTVAQWYGLGQMEADGRIFRITDSGYARRIDGLSLDTGGE